MAQGTEDGGFAGVGKLVKTGRGGEVGETFWSCHGRVCVSSLRPCSWEAGETESGLGILRFVTVKGQSASGT